MLNMEKQQKNNKPPSFSLVITGLILIAIWLFVAIPWKDEVQSLSVFHVLVDEGMQTIYLIVLLFGIFLLGLGLLRLLHASWAKKAKLQEPSINTKK